MFIVMEDNKNTNVSCGGCGCGCLSLIVTFLLITFTVTCLVNSCKRGSLWEGCVETAHEYYQTADSVWNK